MSRDDCYWYSQGQCRLETLPDEFIRYALRQSPQARLDVLNPCTGCEDPDPKWEALAEKWLKTLDGRTATEKFVEANRTHRDHHRRLAKAPLKSMTKSISKDNDE